MNDLLSSAISRELALNEAEGSPRRASSSIMTGKERMSKAIDSSGARSLCARERESDERRGVVRDGESSQR